MIFEPNHRKSLHFCILEGLKTNTHLHNHSELIQNGKDESSYQTNTCLCGYVKKHKHSGEGRKTGKNGQFEFEVMAMLKPLWRLKHKSDTKGISVLEIELPNWKASNSEFSEGTLKEFEIRYWLEWLVPFSCAWWAVILNQRFLHVVMSHKRQW